VLVPPPASSKVFLCLSQKGIEKQQRLLKIIHIGYRFFRFALDTIVLSGPSLLVITTPCEPFVEVGQGMLPGTIARPDDLFGPAHILRPLRLGSEGRLAASGVGSGCVEDGNGAAPPTSRVSAGEGELHGGGERQGDEVVGSSC
jgi:hypothetical protein